MFRNTLKIERVAVSVSRFFPCSPGLFIVLALSLLLSPHGVALAATADLYTGSGMVLHLSRERAKASEVKGVLYSREAAYKFEAKRRGSAFRARALYARNDRLAPYRAVEGTLELQFRDGDDKVILEMNSPIRSVSAVFRRQMDARAYNLLGQYGDSYCDLNHLVLLVADRPTDASGGWLSRVMQEDSDLMPVIGLFFGPRVWYSFQAEGDPATGITSASLVIGDGALEGYLGTATLKARLEASRLLYTYSDAGGASTYQFTYRSQDKLCARVVTRWATRRRMPRGRVAAEVEPATKKPAEGPKVPVAVKAEERPPGVVEPEKPQAVEEKSPVAPADAGTAPAGDVAVKPVRKTRSEEPPVETVPSEADTPEPAPADEPQFKEGDEAGRREELFPEDLPADTPGQELLPEEYELLPEDVYPYPEGELYQPLPGEEYPEDPLYNEPLEELPPGEFPEPAQ